MDKLVANAFELAKLSHSHLIRNDKTERSFGNTMTPGVCLPLPKVIYTYEGGLLSM